MIKDFFSDWNRQDSLNLATVIFCVVITYMVW